MTESAKIAAQTIRSRTNHFNPHFGIILGSGLSALADQITESLVFDYQDLSGFPVRLIEGHQAQLITGYIKHTPVVCLRGRAHYYDGCESSEILTYVRTLKLLGCHTVMITGAVGSLRAEIQPGQLILLRDHINFQGKNPLAGINHAEFGLRFPDMSEAYDRIWRRQLEKIGYDLSIPLMEGVYISVLGPCFETPAEIRMFRDFGADVIGMSVVPEVIAARHCGMRVVGLTVVTNLAAGLTNSTQSHEETLLNAELSTAHLVRLISGFLGDARI